MLHIHAAVFPENDVLFFQQLSLLEKSWGRTAGMIDYPVAWIIAVKLGSAEHCSYQSCIFAPANQRGNLPVGSHAALRNLADYR